MRNVAPMSSFAHAIVRPPGKSFAEGLTSADLGTPDYALALAQHEAYCAALVRAGLRVTHMAPSDRYPDAAFVEDVAIVAGGRALLTRPGAPARRGEVALARETLARFFSPLDALETPATLDGGDVCQAGGHFFIGLSDRTNATGAERLSEWLERGGFTSSVIDIRGIPAALHLKSVMACIDDQTLLAVDEIVLHPALASRDVLRVPPGEAYAANCVRVNDRVLLSAGFPAVANTLAGRGYVLEMLDVSEFRKMDGGLSCLSLRF